MTSAPCTTWLTRETSYRSPVGHLAAWCAKKSAINDIPMRSTPDHREISTSVAVCCDCRSTRASSCFIYLPMLQGIYISCVPNPVVVYNSWRDSTRDNMGPQEGVEAAEQQSFQEVSWSPFCLGPANATRHSASGCWLCLDRCPSSGA